MLVVIKRLKCFLHPLFTHEDQIFYPNHDAYKPYSVLTCINCNYVKKIETHKKIHWELFAIKDGFLGTEGIYKKVEKPYYFLV